MKSNTKLSSILLCSLLVLALGFGCGCSSSSSSDSGGSDDDDSGSTERQGGTVTLSGSLSVTSSANIAANNVSKAATAENYIVHALNTATGGQETTTADSSGVFSFDIAADANYMVNLLSSDHQYIGTLATGTVSDGKVSVGLTTGSDGTTTSLGTVTADTATGQVTSDQTLDSDDDQLAATTDGIVAGAAASDGSAGDGTTDYSSTTGGACTAAAIDCPDYDHDGIPDVFDTDNDNDGYSDQVDGSVDLCVPGTVTLYIENYPTSPEAEQEGFPTPAEVDADLAANSMYQIHLEFTPGSGYSVSDVDEIAVTTPSYIDSYGYVYNVDSSHDCFNTLWTDCTVDGTSYSKKLLPSEDGTKFEVALADIELARAGILENMFPNDTFILHIKLTSGVTHDCTKKINIIPKYFPYALEKGGTPVANLPEGVDVHTGWGGTFTLSWSISDRAPAGMTYGLRVAPYGTSCSDWDPDNYTDMSAGQDGTSLEIIQGDLPTSDVNLWGFQLYCNDAYGDYTHSNWVYFTSEDTDPCP